MGMRFDDIMAPLGAEAFRRDYLGKRPVHIEGGAEKFASIMNWSILERLLDVTRSGTRPASSWCSTRSPSHPRPSRPASRDHRRRMADPAKVKRFVGQGATMVLNDIDQLTPELTAFAKSMEEALGGKSRATLPVLQTPAGFKVHYDTHDVFAVHCEGEKVWPVFEGRADDPIAHNMFKSVPQEVHERPRASSGRRSASSPATSSTAARPVPLRARRRWRLHPHRLRRHLPDRHRRRALPLRAADRRAALPQEPAAGDSLALERHLAGWPGGSARSWASPGAGPTSRLIRWATATAARPGTWRRSLEPEAATYAVKGAGSG
jgi:hypothetical protein